MKSLALLVAIVLVLALLAGCAPKAAPAPAPAPASASTPSPAPPPTPSPTPTPTLKEVELKYDDGRYDGASSISGQGRGFLVQFSPPSTPFTITKVSIFGGLFGTGYENRTFDVQIWDKDLKEIYSKSYPHTKFGLSPAWVEIDIPEVTISSDFYVFVTTYSPTEGGVRIGVDTSVKNEHSEVTDKWKIADWPSSLYPKESCNWMIRVGGRFWGTN